MKNIDIDNALNEYHFSKLLKKFEFNDKPAYIVELKEIEINSNKSCKKRYLSFFENHKGVVKIHRFWEEKEILIKRRELSSCFKNLSDHCLLSECTDASHMFNDSNITHFEADCSSLVTATNMFRISNLRYLKADFQNVVFGNGMFMGTGILSFNSNINNLEDASNMFAYSLIKSFKSNMPSCKKASKMFFMSNIEEINFNPANIEEIDGIFLGVDGKLKKDKPYLFV